MDQFVRKAVFVSKPYVVVQWTTTGTTRSDVVHVGQDEPRRSWEREAKSMDADNVASPEHSRRRCSLEEGTEAGAVVRAGEVYGEPGERQLRGLRQMGCRRSESQRESKSTAGTSTGNANTNPRGSEGIRQEIRVVAVGGDPAKAE